MEYQNVFPKKLQALREQRRLSRRTLAELCGLSGNMVGLYERGEKEPSVSLLDLIQIKKAAVPIPLQARIRLAEKSMLGFAQKIS